MNIKNITLAALAAIALQVGTVDAQTNVQKQIPALQSDFRINVKSGDASDFQPGGNIEKSFDGTADLYHSSWSHTRMPVTLDYNLNKAQRVDYIVYTPRTDSDNGRFGEIELWVSTRRKPEFSKIGNYDFKISSNPS